MLKKILLYPVGYVLLFWWLAFLLAGGIWFITVPLGVVLILLAITPLLTVLGAKIALGVGIALIFCAAIGQILIFFKQYPDA